MTTERSLPLSSWSSQKKNGDIYPPNTVYQLVCGLQRNWFKVYSTYIQIDIDAAIDEFSRTNPSLVPRLPLLYLGGGVLPGRETKGLVFSNGSDGVSSFSTPPSKRFSNQRDKSDASFMASIVMDMALSVPSNSWGMNFSTNCELLLDRWNHCDINSSSSATREIDICLMRARTSNKSKDFLPGSQGADKKKTKKLHHTMIQGGTASEEHQIRR